MSVSFAPEYDSMPESSLSCVMFPSTTLPGDAERRIPGAARSYCRALLKVTLSRTSVRVDPVFSSIPA